MSRMAPPTQSLSAVSPGVTQQIQSAGNMGLQQQQINNNAMAQRNQETIAREKIASQEFMTSDALEQKKFESLLQTQNYMRMNQKDRDIAKMTNDTRMSEQAGVQSRFQTAQDFKERAHNENIKLTKDANVLKMRIALAQDSYDPAARDELRELERLQVERTLGLEEAKKRMAGDEAGARKIRATTLKALEQQRKAIDPVIERGMQSVASMMTVASGNDFGLTGRSGAGPITHPDAWSVRGLKDWNAETDTGPYGEGIGDFIGGVLHVGQELVTGGMGDYASPANENIATLLENPDFATTASARYASKTIAQALVGSFPQANQAKLSAILDAHFQTPVSGVDPEVMATKVGQFTRDLQGEGVNPIVAGEIIRRISDTFRDSHQGFASSHGVSANTMRRETTEENVPALIQARIFGNQNRLNALAQLMPSMAPYESIIAGAGSGNVVEIGEVRSLMSENGLNPNDIDALLDAAERLEEGRKGMLDRERDLEMGIQGIRRAGVDAGIDNNDRRNKMIRELVNDFDNG